MTALLERPARAAAVHWETRQFANAPDTQVTVDRVSARAAYQLVLHRRAVLVDIRGEAQRRAESAVDPRLRPVAVEPHLLAGEAARLGAGTCLLLLCEDGYASSHAAARLARLGVDAREIVGGLGAWREAGLPTVSTR